MATSAKGMTWLDTFTITSGCTQSSFGVGPMHKQNLSVLGAIQSMMDLQLTCTLPQSHTWMAGTS